jgi:hypothetical protein
MSEMTTLADLYEQRDREYRALEERMTRFRREIAEIIITVAGGNVCIKSDKRVPPNVIMAEHDYRQWLMSSPAGMLARVDGGDPGDEDDGE